MSHNIFNNDEIVLAETRAWHGLGVILPEAPTLREAIEHANLGWTVEQRKLTTNFGGEQIVIPDQVANIRSDTHEVLGIVGDRYEVFQNHEVADFIEGVCKSAKVEVESAGSLRNGRDVFFCIRNDSFDAGGADDEVQTYTLFRTTHDGSASFRALGTSVRVVCANTLNYALTRAGAQQGVSIRHTKNLRNQIEEAQDVLFGVQKAAKVFREKVDFLAGRQWTKAETQAFFLQVYEKANGKIPTKPNGKQQERSFRRAQGIITQWVENLENSRNAIDGIRGTAWSAFNAVTEWADHSRTVRRKDDSVSVRDTRVHSNIFGSSSSFKLDAIDTALELAK